MSRRLLCGLLIAAYAVLIIPFADLQRKRPIEVKLGYLPHAQILKVNPASMEGRIGKALDTMQRRIGDLLARAAAGIHRACIP